MMVKSPHVKLKLEYAILGIGPKLWHFDFLMVFVIISHGESNISFFPFLEDKNTNAFEKAVKFGGRERKQLLS